MTISDLYDYLHLKQRIISRCLNLSHGKMNKQQRRSLQSAYRRYIQLEDSLDALCESVYYFQLGEDK